jgi:hypothetical protein
MNSIISWLGSARDYFLSQYYSASGWPYVGGLIGSVFYYLYLFFYYFSYYFGQFNSWLVWAAGRINQILDWNLIKNKILEWFPALQSVYDWVRNEWNNIISDVTTWWGASNNPIRVFISSAISVAIAPFNWVITEFNNLKVAWDNFWTVTFPEWKAKAEAIISFFVGEFDLFRQDPIKYLREKFEIYILPWAIENIPFVGTVYNWYINHKEFITEFLNDPWGYLVNWAKETIAAWVSEHLPWLPKAFTFFENLWEDVTSFFNNPTVWLANIIDFEFIGDDLSEGVKAGGGTDELVAEIASTLPDIKTVSNELIDILSSEELMKADEFWADVELALNEVISELEAAEAKKGAI